MRKVIVLMALMAFIGAAMGQTSWPTWSDPAMKYGIGPGFNPSYFTYPDQTMTKNVTFNFEQSVQGSGYFMTYKYAKVGALAVKDYVHGSGSIDNEATLFTQELNQYNHPVNADWNDFRQACIQLREDNVMVYSPMRIAIGNGYYGPESPITFDSLLKEKTWVKNYRAATSMHHEVEYAHGIDKKLDVTAKEFYNKTYDPVYEGVGATQMKVDEHVDDGKIHFGVLQGAVDNTAAEYWTAYYNTMPTDFSALAGPTGYLPYKNPAVEIDEDYFGTYDIVKNMTLEVPYKHVLRGDDWLPCCSGGWIDMRPTDKKGFGKSANGIFDCSCFEVPTVAEFQRTY